MADTVKISGESKGIGKGTIKVKVLNFCDDEPIAKADALTSGRRAVSDKSGVAVLTRVPENKHSVRVIKNFPEADYFTFLMHYPKATVSHKAQSKERIDVKLGKADTKEIEVKLKAFRVVNRVVFKRIYIHPSKGDDAPGHWWVELDGKESYGWYPKYKPGDNRNNASPKPEKPAEPSSNANVAETSDYIWNFVAYKAGEITYSLKENTVIQCFRGVEGELNGVTRYKQASPNRDYHHGGKADDVFNLVTDCDIANCNNDKCNKSKCNNTDANIFTKIRDFAKSYNGQWSWRFEMFANDNCHEFQIKMMKEKDFKYFRDVN